MFPNPYLNTDVRVHERMRRSGSAVAGRWRNRLGSTMALEVDDDHRISGDFHPGVGIGNPADACRIVGFVEGDAISFCVDFGNRGSVATWTGHHVTDDQHGERLVTLWHLAQPVDDPHSELDTWRAILAGGDEFHRDD